MAYIDPNTGGTLFQILATLFALFSGMVLIFSSKIRQAFARLKRFWREAKGEGERQEAQTETPENE